MSNKTKNPRCVKTLVPFSRDNKLPVYAGVRVRNALQDVTEDMTLYTFGKLTVVLQAVYEQGKKDGARGVSESFQKMMKDIPHLNPGQPKKRKNGTVQAR